MVEKSLLFLLLALGLHLAFAQCPDWSAVTTAAAMSKVNATCFAALQYRTVQNFPASVCAGITVEQESYLATVKPFDACDGFERGCFSNLQSLAGMSAECISRLPAKVCGAASGGLLSTSSHVSSFTQACLKQVTVAECAHYTPAFTQQLGQLDVRQCQAISVDCFTQLTGAAFTVLAPQCLASLFSINVGMCANITAPQAQSLQADQAAVFGDDCVVALNPQACHSLPLQLLPPSTCHVLTGSCLRAIPSLAAVSTDCTARLSAGSCAFFHAETLPTLRPNALSPQCLAAVPPAVCGAFAAPYLSSLGGMECASLDAACILQQNNFGAFSHACAYAMSLDVMSNATLPQIVSFTANAVSAFSAEVFEILVLRFGGAVCEALPIPVTRVDAASNFNARMVARGYVYSYNISAQATDATWLQVAFAANGADFVLHNFATLQPNAFQGIRGDQIVHLVSVFPSFSSDQVRMLNCDAVNSLDAATLRHSFSLQDLPFPRFNRLDQFRVWTDSEWVAVWAHTSAVNGMSCPTVLALPQDLFNSLFAVCTAAASQRYLDWQRRGSCEGINVAGVVPCSAWMRVAQLSLQSTSSSPTQHTTPFTLPPTTAPAGPAVTWPIIVGCVLGLVVVVAIVVVIIVIVRRRRGLASVTYTALNNTDGGREIDLGSDW